MSVIMYPVARIIRDFLVEEGVGYDYSASTDWSIATAAMPTKPFNCITIYDEQSTKVVGYLGEGIQEDWVFSIEIRSTEQEPGQYKAKEIIKALDGLADWVWVGGSSEYSQTVTIAHARRDRGIFPMGRDENGRWKFNLEYALMVQSVED